MNVLDLKQELDAVSLLTQARRETLSSQPTAVDQSKEEALVANLAKKKSNELGMSLGGSPDTISNFESKYCAGLLQGGSEEQH